MGAKAWQAALAPDGDEGGFMCNATLALMACKVAAMCPHAAVREDFMKTLWRQQSGITVIAGAELLVKGHTMTDMSASYVLETMARTPGGPLPALPHSCH